MHLFSENEQQKPYKHGKMEEKNIIIIMIMIGLMVMVILMIMIMVKVMKAQW